MLIGVPLLSTTEVSAPCWLMSRRWVVMASAMPVGAGALVSKRSVMCWVGEGIEVAIIRERSEDRAIMAGNSGSIVVDIVRRRL